MEEYNYENAVSYIFPDVDIESETEDPPIFNPAFDIPVQTAAPAEISEDLASILYSYNAVMADFQTNMNLYQRNIGLALGANQYGNIRRATHRQYADMSPFVETTVYAAPGDGVEPGTCPISLDQFESGDSISKIRICGHEFKAAPLDAWFRRSNTVCPICRNDVRGTQIPAASHIPIPVGPSMSDHTRIAAHIITAFTRGFGHAN